MTEEILQTDKSPEELASQVVSFFLHVLVAVLTVAAIFTVFFISGVEQVTAIGILMAVLCFFVPMLVGYLVHMRLLHSAGPSIWIAGCIWLLIIGVYVLQMPTGPGQCEHCGAVQKIWLTLFDPLKDSNLLNGQGRLLGTWPALGMFGYAIGAGIAMRRRSVY